MVLVEGLEREVAGRDEGKEEGKVSLESGEASVVEGGSEVERAGQFCYGSKEDVIGSKQVIAEGLLGKPVDQLLVDVWWRLGMMMMIMCAGWWQDGERDKGRSRDWLVVVVGIDVAWFEIVLSTSGFGRPNGLASPG
jgi:hypothetical protein